MRPFTWLRDRIRGYTDMDKVAVLMKMTNPENRPGSIVYLTEPEMRAYGSVVIRPSYFGNNPVKVLKVEDRCRLKN